MSPIRGFFGSQLNKATPTISIDFDYWDNVSYLGDTIVILLTSNGNWTATEDSFGLSLSPTSGSSGVTHVTITWGSNGSKFCRYGEISFTNNGVSTFLTTSQQGTLEVECEPA